MEAMRHSGQEIDPMESPYSDRRTGRQFARVGYLYLTWLLVGCLAMHAFLSVWAVLVNLTWRTVDVAFFDGFAWIALLMLVLGAIGRIPRALLILTLLVIALLILQALLISSSRDLSAFAVSGLHAPNALVLLGVSVPLGRRAQRFVRASDTVRARSKRALRITRR